MERWLLLTRFLNINLYINLRARSRRQNILASRINWVLKLSQPVKSNFLGNFFDHEELRIGNMRFGWGDGADSWTLSTTQLIPHQT